jgi:hypothetical protein
MPAFTHRKSPVEYHLLDVDRWNGIEVSGYYRPNYGTLVCNVCYAKPPHFEAFMADVMAWFHSHGVPVFDVDFARPVPSVLMGVYHVESTAQYSGSYRFEMQAVTDGVASPLLDQFMTFLAPNFFQVFVGRELWEKDIPSDAVVVAMEDDIEGVCRKHEIAVRYYRNFERGVAGDAMVDVVSEQRGIAKNRINLFAVAASDLILLRSAVPVFRAIEYRQYLACRMSGRVRGKMNRKAIADEFRAYFSQGDL